MCVSDWIDLLSAIATIGGVFVVLCQTKKISQQLTLQHFSDYTKRYQEIILNFPEDINSATFVLIGRDDYNKTMRYLRAYLDLCYEEWYLNECALIDKNIDIWNIWKGGMETAFSKTAFHQAWEIIRTDSNFGVAFSEFIDSCIHNSIVTSSSTEAFNINSL